MTIFGTCKKLGRSLLYMIGTCAAVEVCAHHSPASYDQTKEAVVEGVLTEVFWRNPHVYLTVENVAEDGTVVTQEIEVTAPSSLLSQGVRQDDLKVGERVSVRVYPNRWGAGREVLGLALTRQNGTVVALRGGVLAPSSPPRAEEAPGLAGVWTPDARQFAVLARVVREEQSWPFTAAGRAAAADTATLLAMEANCAPHGIPTIMMAPGITVIDVTADRVIFDLDGANVQRVIHLGITSPPADVSPTPEGYAIGRWEGATLVVETTAFAPNPKGLGFALPSSAGKRVVERFALGADRRSLDYAAILEDPEYLAEPVSMSTTWTYRPDLKSSGLGCDLESALRFQTPPAAK